MARRNLLERAAKFLKTGLDANASKPVNIIDGNEAIEDVMAIPGKSEFTTFDLDDHVGSAKTFDWCVSAADLAFAGDKRDPAPGWEIHLRLDDGRTAVFIAVQEGPRCFDVMDQLGILFRIHTQLERIEPP